MPCLYHERRGARSPTEVHDAKPWPGAHRLPPRLARPRLRPRHRRRAARSRRGRRRRARRPRGPPMTRALTLALATLLAAAPARAFFVRSTTDDGTPVYWNGGCTWIIPDSSPAPALTSDPFQATIQKSIANW